MDKESLENRLKQAYDAVSGLYGTNYADTHPELIAACMNSQAIDELIHKASDIGDAIDAIKDSMMSLNNNMTTIFENKHKM